MVRAVSSPPRAMPDPSASSSLRRDIASAYVASASRIASWVVVSAVVYRTIGAEAFGLVALVRATVGLLGYAGIGLGPALIRVLSVAKRSSYGVHSLPDDRVLPYEPL